MGITSVDEASTSSAAARNEMVHYATVLPRIKLCLRIARLVVLAILHRSVSTSSCFNISGQGVSPTGYCVVNAQEEERATPRSTSAIKSGTRKTQASGATLRRQQSIIHDWRGRARERSVIIVSDRPIRGYLAQRAAFGDPMLEMVQANLVLPPDLQNETLCAYPERAIRTFLTRWNESKTSNATAHTSTTAEFWPSDDKIGDEGFQGINSSFDAAGGNENMTFANGTGVDRVNCAMLHNEFPLAVLVQGDYCSAETQTRVFQRMQVALFPFFNLRYLLISGSRGNNSLPILRLDHDSRGTNNTEGNSSDDSASLLKSVGVLHLPFSNAADLKQRMVGRAYSRSSDYHFLSPDNVFWLFPIRIVNESDAADYIHSDDSIGDSNGNNSDKRNDLSPNFVWFRFVLFTLLIVSPCFRACFLWYYGGGRILLRRNGNGRVIGLAFVR
jgi:hypothetical protein